MHKRPNLITGLLALALLLALAACEGSSTAGKTGGTSTPNPSKPTATSASTTSATATPTLPPGVTAAVNMSTNSFTGANSITIKTGQAIVFNDPAVVGGIHQLISGSGGVFKAQAGVPAIFNSENGTYFNSGDSKQVTFPTAGTFTITCAIHPNMLVTIIVKA